MDDILFYGSNMNKHDARSARPQGEWTKVKRQQVSLLPERVKVPSKSISQEGVGISRDKVAAFQNLAPPTNVTELKRAFGMINYLCSYIDQLSTVLKPLNDLLKCDIYWFWGPE